MKSYRTTGDLARHSTARLADETPSPQRLPAQPINVSAARLRQLAADRRREAAGLEKHVPPHDSTAAWFARQRITALREEARDLEREAGGGSEGAR